MWMWFTFKVWLLVKTSPLVFVFPRYYRVQSALTQQSSELQDTRMLTEFLERVELEESQDLSGSRYRLDPVRSLFQG